VTIAVWESRIDGIRYERDPSERPDVSPGVAFGRKWGLFGNTETGPSATTSGGPDWAMWWQVKHELLTIAAAANSNTVDATMLPANSLIQAVVGRFTAAPGGSTTCTIGDATTAGRFATGVSTALNTTFRGILHWSGAVTTLAAGPSQAADAGIRVTPNTTPTNALGRLRLWSIFQPFGVPSN
jgi:hypothetical protein